MLARLMTSSRLPTAHYDRIKVAPSLSVEESRSLDSRWNWFSATLDKSTIDGDNHASRKPRGLLFGIYHTLTIPSNSFPRENWTEPCTQLEEKGARRKRNELEEIHRFIVYSEQIQETLSMMRNWLCFKINKIIILIILVFVERMMMQIVYDDSFRYNYYTPAFSMDTLLVLKDWIFF